MREPSSANNTIIVDKCSWRTSFRERVLAALLAITLLHMMQSHLRMTAFTMHIMETTEQPLGNERNYNVSNKNEAKVLRAAATSTSNRSELLERLVVEEFHESGNGAPELMQDKMNDTINDTNSSYLDKKSFSDSTTNNTLVSTKLVEDFVSLDYVGCCGLGHRLLRMSSAYHLARILLRADLRTFWGWCQQQQQPEGEEEVPQGGRTRQAKEVFSSLFEPENINFLLLEDFQENNNASTSNNTTSRYHVRYSVANNVGGYFEASRKNLAGKNSTTCGCHPDKIASDYEFYSGLLKRYRHRDFIDSFVKEQFANYTVYGLHVRAGNGEQGDFAEKDRGLKQNASDYVHFVAQAILHQYNNTLVQKQRNLPPPLLYVATDTPEYIALFRQELHNIMPVLDLPQERTEDGVFFGVTGQESKTVEQCLQRWRDAVNDMMLLSRADVVIAGRPSSFIQSMPLSIAFGKTLEDRRTPEVYCEVQGRSSAESFECYQSYHEWCCETTPWIGREFVQFLQDMDSPAEVIPPPQERPQDRSYCRPHPDNMDWPRNLCLPHDWSVDGF